MDDLGGAVGTVTEGGLYARAIDGRQASLSPTPDADGHFEESECLNCGARLLGPHCHQCGQEAHLHRTVGALFHDLLHGALHFEGKTFRTLPALILRPGELTRRYIAGERKRFVSPMAMFLFSIFMMFAVFQAVGLSAPSDLKWDADAPAELQAARQDAAAERAELKDALAGAEAGSDRYRRLEQRISDADLEIAGIDEAIGILGATGAETAATGGASAPNEEQRGYWDHVYDKWEKNPGLMLYKLQSNGYKFSWMLIPISVPFLWLLFFWKRQFGAYDHAVFVTYSIAFMSLLFIALSVIFKLGVSSFVWGALLLIIPPLHIYRQLRGAYGLSRFSALWRLTVISSFIWIIAGLFIPLLFVIGSF